jgi:hypothetical protein
MHDKPKPKLDDKPEPDVIVRPEEELVGQVDDPADQPPPTLMVFDVPAPGRERLYGRFDVPPTVRTIANVQRQDRVIE